MKCPLQIESGATHQNPGNATGAAAYRRETFLPGEGGRLSHRDVHQALFVDLYFGPRN
jgi:hypothetical protein